MTAAAIQKILQENFKPEVIEVFDQSRAHAGHAEAQKSGGGHYEVVIVSEKFVGKKLLERHRMVYETLAKEIKSGIHALRITTLTKGEWLEKKI